MNTLNAPSFANHIIPSSLQSYLFVEQVYWKPARSMLIGNGVYSFSLTWGCILVIIIWLIRPPEEKVPWRMNSLIIHGGPCHALWGVHRLPIWARSDLSHCSTMCEYWNYVEVIFIVSFTFQIIPSLFQQVLIKHWGLVMNNYKHWPLCASYNHRTPRLSLCLTMNTN